MNYYSRKRQAGSACHQAHHPRLQEPSCDNLFVSDAATTLSRLGPQMCFRLVEALDVSLNPCTICPLSPDNLIHL